MLERSEASNPVILTTERRKDLKNSCVSDGGEKNREKKQIMGNDKLNATSPFAKGDVVFNGKEESICQGEFQTDSFRNHNKCR